MQSWEILGYTHLTDALADKKYTRSEMVELLRLAKQDSQYTEPKLYSCPSCKYEATMPFWGNDNSCGCPRCGYHQRQKIN